MSDDLCRLSAVELRDGYRARRFSPVEVVRAVLARAEALQPTLNCFITLCGERALDEARRAETQLLGGERLGTCVGIPMTVKDICNTEGVRTTFGAVPFADNVPDHDAVAVARLRAAGAILIGKTTTPEFGTKCLTDSPLFGKTRNAWSAERSSGGSSGGAAVAVAAGIAPFAVATDGGGSTRIPAACNGVVGIKQTIGVIPHSQVQDAIGNQTYVTPMTRTVADTALMMSAMAGPDSSDPWSLGAREMSFSTEPATTDLKGRRVLACLTPPGRIVSADARRCFEDGLARLAAMGAEIEEMPGDGFEVEQVWRTVNHTAWRTRFQVLADQHRESLSPTFLRQLDLAASYSSIDYQRAMFERTALFRRVQGLLETAEFLAMPTLTRTALPLDLDLFDPITIDGHEFADVRPNWFPWTMPFNLTGHPAVTVPCGFGSDGCPLGIQLVGRFRRDDDLLAFASAFEQASDLLGRSPSL